MKKIWKSTKFKKNLLSMVVLSAFALPFSASGDQLGFNPISEATNSFQNSEAKKSLLEDLVVRSDLIFRGKLIDKSEKLSIEGVPYTFVTYDIGEVIAGQYSNDTITLKFVGGEFPNGNRLTASNAPAVEVGEDSILMVQQSIDTGCDFVDCEGGRFLIKGGKVIAANESAVTVNDQGGVDYISLAARENGQHKSSLAKSDIPSFIAHLKRLNQTSSLQMKSAKAPAFNTDKYVPFKAYSGLTKAGKAPEVPKSAVNNKSRELKGDSFDQWEVEQLKKNGGNPLL